ncbi:MAG: bifunctional folylpolyglutamate synthase/dihydrofolate synthase [Bradymonadia bacterium]
MSDRYAATLQRLFNLTRFGEKLDLSTPKALATMLEHPLSKYQSVLIGGTNGKGSTAVMTETLLRGAGVRTGLFTSPHLVQFTERIQVDGAPVAEEVLCRWADRVLEQAEGQGIKPSFFEAVWAMATGIFAEAGVDVAVWEVGLGGRLDATNVCEPVASAVVSVGLDHVHVLGDTLEAIAGEKVAIFREGRPAITGAQGEALEAVRCRWPGPLVEIGPEHAEWLPPLPLPGAHQRINAAVAMALVDAVGVSPDRSHLTAVRWPGRGERLDGVILDVAHNPASARALAAWLDDAELGPLTVIFGAMADKDVAGVIAPLQRHIGALHLVTPVYPRRMTAEALAEIPEVAAMQPVVGPNTSVGATLDALRGKGAPPLLVTGSCFLVGEARAHLLGVEFPERGLITTAR